MHNNTEALEDVESALQFIPESMRDALEAALSGLSIDGNGNLSFGGGTGGSGTGGKSGTKMTFYSGIIDKNTGKNISFYSTSDNVYNALAEQGIDRDSVSLANQQSVTYYTGGGGGGGNKTSNKSNDNKNNNTQGKTLSDMKASGDPDSMLFHATGTISSNTGFSFVDELGEELIVRPPSQGRLTYLEKGTGIIPANITKNLWKMGQNPHEFFENEFGKQIAKYNGFTYDTSGGSMSIVIGDIQLNGVQDVNTLSRAIVSQLPNQIIRDLYSRK